MTKLPISLLRTCRSLVQRFDLDIAVPNGIAMILKSDMALLVLAEFLPVLELAGCDFFVPIVASQFSLDKPSHYSSGQIKPVIQISSLKIS